MPGAEAHPAALSKQLDAAWKARPEGYVPRTVHLSEDGTPRFTNRLFLESSPYLRQHAHNPVNWFPWGPEAFELAKKLDRPVFLSVGYSTCHWCHVMEEESFEDEEIAAFLNANYVAVKVDREERPDIDAIYMAFLQAATGRGGWPMSVWMTPDQKPFQGATYIPPRDGDRGARVGFLTRLKGLAGTFKSRRGSIDSQGTAMVRALRSRVEVKPLDKLTRLTAYGRLANYFKTHYDEKYGGLTRGAAKFPSSMHVEALLRHWEMTDDEESLEMVRNTLHHMAAGGMYDQVGGGFHRYSTDHQWLVPHFEKMLYDNALIPLDYLAAYRATADPALLEVVRDVLRYVDREMTTPEGGFYSATDADSLNPEKGEREEGWFFTWTVEELEALLGEKQAAVVRTYYDMSRSGNFEGRSILHRPRSDEEVAAELGIEVDALRKQIAAARDAMYRERLTRPAPLRDDKVLTAWNALMIRAYTQAGWIMSEPAYLETARRSARFLLKTMRGKDGRLLRSYIGGKASGNGFLQDYAFSIAALLDLYEATGETEWIEAAVELEKQVEKHFVDAERGGYYQTRDDHEALIIREKTMVDSAIPGGNSVHAMNLSRLAFLTTDDTYRQRALKCMLGVSRVLGLNAPAMPEMLASIYWHKEPVREIAIVVPESRDQAEPLLDEIRKRFLPAAVQVVAVQGPDLEAQAKYVPWLAQKRAIRGKPTAYLCFQGVCKLPTSDPEEFARQLRQPPPIPEPEIQEATAN
ncbi:hypothetical protein ABI59_11385 [Acidobacteria bacterium Mor1]|nr:hypothetical protein ABI59_11385 [Acidobacteria bacterium Mor1]